MMVIYHIITLIGICNLDDGFYAYGVWSENTESSYINSTA